MRAFVVALVLSAVLPVWAKNDVAVPRVVTPRGPLGADELNNIQVFKAASPSVVHITTLQTQRDFFSRNVSQVPSGRGGGGHLPAPHSAPGFGVGSHCARIPRYTRTRCLIPNCQG